MVENYLGNPNLKKANTPVEFTAEDIKEFKKCASNPVYFITKYIKITTLDHGLQPFKMYNFQKEMIGTFHKNRYSIYCFIR